MRLVRWVALGAIVTGLFAGSAHGTTTPTPGQQFPKEFVELRKNHPELFRMKRGLVGKTERAKQRRALELQPHNLVHVDHDSGKVITKGGEFDRAAFAVTGTVPVPVVPVMFTPATAPAPPTATRIDEILFTGPNPPDGTATDYYTEVSYGLITLDGTVFPYTTLGSADTVYEGGSNGLPTTVGSCDKTATLISDALGILDATADFSLFDNDGPDGVPNSGDDDGFVDLVAFLHPESGGECGGSNIWAHRWTYTGWCGAPYTTNDAAAGGGFIRIDDYNIQGALTCTNAEMDIGTFCHETGHIFGIPDLYDTATAAPSQGVGFWSLMASGNWNSQTSPAHMSAWEKSELGWLIPTLLVGQTNGLAIPQVETNPTAFQLGSGNGEYFLVENRQAVGFDQNLQTCGLAIWHVDEAIIDARTPTNTVNNLQNCGAFVEVAGQHYGLALEQADGACNLEANQNRGDAGDLYPGSTSNTAFTETSTPNSDNNLGVSTTVRVTNISGCGATMNADVDAFAIPATPAPTDIVFLIDNTGSYTDDWPNIQAQMPGIVSKIQAVVPDVRFGLALFRDFPFSPYGGGSDQAYQQVLALTNNATTFLNAVSSMQSPGGGSDLEEAQYEALHQLLFGLGRDLFNDSVNGNQTGEIAPSNIGWVPTRNRIVYLLTDAAFHDSDVESYPTGTPDIPTPTLEAEGRNAVRSQVASFGPGLRLFTFVANNPGAYITQGESGAIPNTGLGQLETQAQELADLTGGGVFYVGTDSAQFTEAIDASLAVLQSAPLVSQVPAVGRRGLLATATLILLGFFVLVRMRGGGPQ